MAESIAMQLKKVWDKWDIPTCVMVSLSLQVFLVVFASRRQRSSSGILQGLIWLAYLAADWIAPATIGLIGKFISGTTGRNEGLYAFWASFLLLHLGGPDCITSYSVEDNALWSRHLIQLFFQMLGAGYCIYLMLPTIISTKLVVPAALMFVVGTVKYAERTAALYLGNMDNFEETVMLKKQQIPDKAAVNDMELVTHAYPLFCVYKGLLAGYTLPFGSMKPGKIYLEKMIDSRVKGFKVIENELSFMYEAFHTKVGLVVGSTVGVIVRLTSFCFIVLALVTFHFVVEVSEFGKTEILLTYALLIGAIVLDTISGIQLLLSDWILVSEGFKRWRTYIPTYFWKRPRWSRSMPQYNILDYYRFLKTHWMCHPTTTMLKLPDFVRGKVHDVKFMLFSSSIREVAVIEDIESFIFREILELSTSVGNDYRQVEDDLLYVTKKYTYRIIDLHIATEICYRRTERESKNYTDEKRKERRRCKVISDYVFYLLMMKSAMLAPVAKKDWLEPLTKRYFSDVDDMLKGIKKIIDVVSPYESKDEGPLFDAWYVVKDFGGGEWKTISSEWVEILVKGGFNCRPILHVKQPSSGGQLLTFTWLLAKHFDLDRRASKF